MRASVPVVMGLPVVTCLLWLLLATNDAHTGALLEGKCSGQLGGQMPRLYAGQCRSRIVVPPGKCRVLH